MTVDATTDAILSENTIEIINPLFVDLPLQSSLLGTAEGDPSFIRATPATYSDLEGLVKTVPSGVARFTGARGVENLLVSTEDMTDAAYSTQDAVIDNATEVTFSGTPGAEVRQVAAIIDDGSGADGRQFVFRVEIALVSGSLTLVEIGITGSAISNETADITANISATSTIFSILANTDASGTIVRPEIVCDDVATLRITKWQLTEVTGQSNQDPAEYVSVGVLSAPFQGAGLDGFQFFGTENVNTVLSNVVTEAKGPAINSSNSKFAQLSGIVGTNFSTPDSTANSPSGNLALTARISTNFTPGTTVLLAAKWESSGDQRAYLWGLNTTGKMFIFLSANGGASVASTSSLSIPFTGLIGDVGVEWNQDTGDITFYTSIDGVNWVQLGILGNIPLAFIFNSTAALEIGSTEAGVSNLKANVYGFQLLDTINGTPAVDFNPNDSDGSTPFNSATTGEEWTANGDASIFAGAGVWDASGPVGYFMEPQRENRILRSSHVTSTEAEWTLINTFTSQTDVNSFLPGQIGVEFNADSTNGSMRNADFTLSPGKESIYCILEQVAGGIESEIKIRDTTAPGDTVRVILTWSSLAISTAGSTGSSISSSVTELIGVGPNGGKVVLLAASAIGISGNTARIVIFPNGQSSPAIGEKVIVHHVQHETADFNTSAIITTTAAVTRNVDSFQLARQDNFSDAAGTVIVEVRVTDPASTAGQIIGIGFSAPLVSITTNSGILSSDGTNVALGPVGTPADSAQFACTWDADTAELIAYADAVNGVVVPYDGDFAAGTIDIGRGDLSSNIRNLKIYNIALSSPEITDTSLVDIVITRTITQKWDISLDSTGDIATADFFDTAILMSLFTEKRASESEVSISSRRRGWIGNESFPDGFEIGSKIWLFEQSRLDRDTLNGITSAAIEGLQWFLTRGLAINLVVDTVLSDGKVTLQMDIFRPNSKVDRRFFSLWDGSGITISED